MYATPPRSLKMMALSAKWCVACLKTSVVTAFAAMASDGRVSDGDGAYEEERAVREPLVEPEQETRSAKKPEQHP